MQCPNKNDINWKIMEDAVGSLAAHGIFNKMGVPDFESNAYYQEYKGKVSQKELVLNAVLSMSNKPVTTTDDMPSVEKEETEEQSRSFKVVQNKKARLRAINAQITAADNANDFKTVNKLSLQKTELQEDIDDLLKQDSLENIIQHGKKDIVFLKSLKNKENISAQEIVAAQKITRLWISANNLMTDEESEELDIFRTELDKTVMAASRMDEWLKERANENVEEFSKDTLKQNFFVKIAKDISKLPSLLLDLSHINDTGVLAMFKSIKLANTKAKEEAVKVMDKLEKLSEPLKKKYKNMDNVYDLLIQKYEDGTRTGHLISKIKPEYEEEKHNKKMAYLQYRGKDEAAFLRARKDYFNFLKENEIMFDVRKLFGKMKGKEAHEKQLRDILGDTEYERRYALLEKKLQDYEERKSAVQKDYIEEYGEAKAKMMMARWLKEFSPYEWAKYVSSPTSAGFKNVTPKGYKFTYSVPKNKSAFDTRFEKLENDSDLMAYYDYMRNTMKTLSKVLPEDQQLRFKNNGIPYIEKNIAEVYNEHGYRHAADSILGALKKSVLTKKQGSKFFQYQDPVTGEFMDSVNAPTLDDRDKVNELNRIKVLEYKQENGKNPSVKERNRLYREAQEEIAQTKSFDLNAVMGAYALQLKAYEHKSQIQDQMELIKRYVYNLEEDLMKNGIVQKKDDGTTVKKGVDDSFKNIKEVLGNHMDTLLYDKPREEEGIIGKDDPTKTKYTKEELEDKERIEKLLEDETLSDKDRKMLNERLVRLGGKVAGSRIADNILKYIQLKGMGLNIPAAITNVQFGWISNAVHALGGEDYSRKNFRDGQRLAWTAMFNGKSKSGKKVRSLMKNLDVLKDSTDEFGKTGLGDKIEDFMYSPTKKAEFVNQAPVMIAMLKEAGVWEDFDEDGNYVGDGSFDIDSFKIKLDQVVKMLHGNYDPDSPINIKKSTLGRMASQFRTWMFESVNNRWQKGEYDQLLGRYKKGRYRNYKLSHLMLYPLVKDFYSAFTTDMNMLEGEAKADVANMRKNFAEIMILSAVVSLALMAKGLADDEEEDEQFVINYLLNNLSRVQADITFYVNPMEAENLINHIIPAASVFHDATSALGASIDLLMGEDEIERGVFAGDSKSARAWGKMVPGITQYYKTYSMLSQIYDIY